MSANSVTIPKDPVLSAAADYYRLRREGIGHLERLGSEKWTDFNTHDPGITILELLSYAITDLSYRIGWDIKDHLANASSQPFFTAREILTVNPVTPDDYRRLMIDLDKVRNAWITCKECMCDTTDVEVKGLYDIKLELEADDEVGDLNDRLISTTFTVTDADGSDHTIDVEVRFPKWDLLSDGLFREFLSLDHGTFTATCSRFMRVKTGQSLMDIIIPDDELRRYWRNVFYATLEITSSSSASVFTIPDVSIRLFSSVEAKNAASTTDVINAMVLGGDGAVLPLYHTKMNLVAEAIEDSRARYHAHRNIDEDICDLVVVDVEHIAVCADVEVDLDADLERVQAEIWYAIENYLNPPISFYNLNELLTDGYAVEDIFNGPVLDNGFIRQEDLEAAQLKEEIRTSDIINLIADIDGVISVSGLQLSAYDSEGQLRTTQDWLLHPLPGHQPRLYHSLSNFIFSKNGLPFALRQDEAFDTLIQLRGANERPKVSNAPKDLYAPKGKSRNAADIVPAQYSLPLTYGIGPEGLPSHVGDARRAQAKQLKAYLMVYEQLLGNAFEQVAHVGDLFSMDPSVDATYFPHQFSDDQIAGYGDVVDDDPVRGLTAETLQQIVETTAEFHDRRNAFLDHIMARFGESFADYALLLTNWKGESLAEERLIEDKLGFLVSYPEISSGRYKAFDHRHQPLLPSNYTILKKRVALLLGFPNLQFTCVYDTPLDPTTNVTAYTLHDPNGNTWLEGNMVFGPGDVESATRETVDFLLHRLSTPSAYQLTSTSDGYRLTIINAASIEVATITQLFDTISDAEAVAEELVAWASNQRSIVVEHLLLRPKFPGDANYNECEDCSEVDPWSFRLTFVMPGWSAPYNTNMDLRDFASKTILEEIPSHLLGKICWVGNDSYEVDECDPVVDELTDLLQEQGVTADGTMPDCEGARACAVKIYSSHAAVLAAWYEENKHKAWRKDELQGVLQTVFSTLTPADMTCGLSIDSIWSQVQDIVIARFIDVVMHGFQFDRFEEAWYAWLKADSIFDWGTEKLTERVEAILTRYVVSSDTVDLCECAKSIILSYGETFHDWIDENLAAGHDLDELTAFVPSAVTLCSEYTFRSGAQDAVQSFLDDRYSAYTEVSYRLARLVRLLESLANTYPAATLHDCEDGSDDNPVRLNRTALGSLTLGASEDIDLNPTDASDPT